MLMRILRGIRDNLDSILDWTEILGSFGALIIILFFNFFGVNTITAEIAVLLSILGLLAVSRRLDRKINQDTRQSTQEVLHAMRTLRVEQTISQGVLQTLGSGMADLGANQSALEQSFQTLSNSVKSLAKNKFYPDQDDAFKILLEYINNNAVKEATFLQYSCKQSEILLYPLVLNKKARAAVYIQHEERIASPNNCLCKRLTRSLSQKMMVSSSRLGRAFSPFRNISERAVRWNKRGRR